MSTPAPATAHLPEVPTRFSHLPLVVDLDRTLLRSDSLHDGLGLLLRNPWRLLVALGVLLTRGRSALKAYVTKQAPLEVTLLPYFAPLLEWLRTEHAGGRRLVLATAAHHHLADQVAKHLGLFEKTLASTDSHNLKGSAKAAALVERFGERGFVYAGDHPSDVAVWRRAAGAVLVGVTPRLRKAAMQVTAVEREFTLPRRGLARRLLQVLRPHQWVKNALVFVPIITSTRFTDAQAWGRAALVFVAFCATASAIYIINDLQDLNADRAHPQKRRRLFATGELAVGAGLVGAVLLAALGAGLAGWLRVGGPLAVYVGLALAYSAVLKEIAMADTFALAGLFCIRLFAGGAATGYHVSVWLFAFSCFAFLGLALLKRAAELRAAAGGATAQVPRRGYYPADLPLITSMGTAASMATAIVLALYVQSVAAADRYRHPELLWFVVPAVLFCFARLWLKTSRGEMHSDPVLFALRNGEFWGVVAVVAALIYFAL